MLDATFFGKRIDKFGLIIVKDIITLAPVSYHFISTESIKEYKRYVLILKHTETVTVTVNDLNTNPVTDATVTLD